MASPPFSSSALSPAPYSNGGAAFFSLSFNRWGKEPTSALEITHRPPRAQRSNANAIAVPRPNKNSTRLRSRRAS